MRRLLLILAFAAPLAAAQTPDELVGEWRLTGTATAPPPAGGYVSEGTPSPFRLTFASDGTVRVESGVDLRHTFDGHTIGVRIGSVGDYEPLEARLTADTLTITDDGDALTFVRDGGTPADGLVGRWLSAAGASPTSGGPPAGFEFADDGTSRAFYVATTPYTAERGTLAIGRPMAFLGNVRVSGDRLTLTEKGRVSRYVRASAWQPQAPVVVLERTPCYGRCPVYTLAAYADGRVVWTGTRHVATLGTAERQVDPAVVAALVAQAGAAGHGRLPERLDGGTGCPRFITDQPGATTTVRTAAGTHSVTHNHGCTGFRGEAALTALEVSIDRALGTSDWGGREPEASAPR